MPNQRAVYEIFDYPGRFKDEKRGADFARYQVEGWRNNVDSATGSSNSPQLQPGRYFNLTDHPREDLNDLWQVVSCKLSGSQPQALIGSEGAGTTLINNFSVIPAIQTWRSQPHPKPRVDGPQSAVVTGPPGEEIFCDEHGRVRVKFTWDRYNQADANSSCWIRVSQSWAGAGFGSIAIPRVGQEVIVDFLNGDPDQPIITGRTYHASNRSPGDLPGTKTQMAIRSQTYKGEGYNELMFEDWTGQELLSMHAQKDMQTEVLNDQTLTVNQHRVKTIKGNELNAITGNRTKIITGNETNAVKGFQGTTVKVGQSIAVKGSVSQLTGGTRVEQAVDTILIGSGTGIRLECGSSALELHANEAIMLSGKSLNIAIEGDAKISTTGALALNPSSPAIAAGVPGESYKESIQSSLDSLFNKDENK
jgi:type VI secretion system secreted protein VgrG